MEMDHQKAIDGVVKKKTFLTYSEEELKIPPIAADQVRKLFTEK